MGEDPLPDLSICMATAAAPERVAGALRPLLETLTVEAEVVIGLDDRLDRALEPAYGVVADRLLWFPYRDPPERSQPWLHAQCRGDWVLRLDGDEVASPGLASAVEGVIRSRAETHAWVRRRWLWPDANRYLAAWPWQPDYQLRLLRRDGAVVRLPGAMHGYAEAVGSCRYLEPPIYHADLLLNDRAAREAKSERYRAMREERRIAGCEFNEAYYLPERWPVPRTAVVPEADRGVVAALLDPPPVGHGRATASVVGAAEVDALWDAAPLDASAYAARIEFIGDEDARIHLGEQRTFDVRLTNVGTRRWPWGASDHPEIRVGQRWLDEGGAVVEGLRTPLPHTVEPAERCLVPALVIAPPHPGRWTLELDLVNEHVRWFGCGVQLDVECVQRSAPPSSRYGGLRL